MSTPSTNSPRLITASARATVEKPSSSQRRACGGLSGRGDPQRALAGLYFWTWDTEEVLDLIRWMRKWNSDPKLSKVKFYGFDTRKMPRAAQVALTYITRVAKGESANWATQLAPLTNELDSQVGAMAPEELQALTKAASALVQRFDAARAAWTSRSSAEAWVVARQHAQILVQSLEVLRLGPLPAAGEARDRPWPRTSTGSPSTRGHSPSWLSGRTTSTSHMAARAGTRWDSSFARAGARRT